MKRISRSRSPLALCLGLSCVLTVLFASTSPKVARADGYCNSLPNSCFLIDKCLIQAYRDYAITDQWLEHLVWERYQISQCLQNEEPFSPEWRAKHDLLNTLALETAYTFQTLEALEVCIAILENELLNCEPNSPLLLDLNDDGFELSSSTDGIYFDLDGDGTPERLSWTLPGTDDGWLALDRNGNGVIDDGTELFGNFSPQTESDAPNGYRALSVFDDPSHGGNGNQRIDPGDEIYGQLCIWVDADADGACSPQELTSLTDFGVRWIQTRYRRSRAVDEYGNEFRYWSRAKIGRRVVWTSDVFLDQALER